MKPESSEAFLAAIEADARGTRDNEPGALQFVLGQNVDDANAFHLHEQYKSKADLDHHESTPHFNTFVEFVKSADPFSAPMIVEKYECAHEPKVNPPRSAYCLNVESCIKAEFRDEFIALMKTHQASSQAEPGCVQFDWGESLETPSTFFIHEQYKDKAAYDAHEKTPHFGKFGVFNAKDPYSKPQVVSFYQVSN